MATVTGFTSARMLAIENSCIISGAVDLAGDLYLEARDSSTVFAGNVRGPTGATGATGAAGTNGTDGATGPAGPAGSGPTGSISLYAGSSAPALHLLCDGSAISRTTYADLFAIVGTTYGTGDGSTTFNVPNLKGRVPVGRDASQTEFDALGESGGAKTHTLTTSEMPSHSHTQDAHSHGLSNATSAATAHSHTLDPANAQAKISIAAVAAPNLFIGRVTTPSWTATHQNGFSSGAAGSSASQTSGAGLIGATENSTAVNTASVNSATASNQNTGGGSEHNNLQPYLVLNYIIRI